jgi:stress-induced-phosphoprotein 1
MENENKNNEYNEKKDMANQYFKEGKYEDAIKLYSEILETDENNHVILSNRSATYIKLEKWDEALKDAVVSTKIKPDWGKAWGRLGAALYGQDKLDEAIVAYNKANELEPSEIYTEMITEIKEKIIEIKNKLVFDDSSNPMGNPAMENLFSTMFDSVISNPKIMEKLTDPEFQGKVLSLQSNPFEALKDKEVMDIMSEMMKNLNTK